MDALKTPDLAARVCPRCGQPPGDQNFCGGCGLNLAQQVELPTAEEYAARLRQEQWLRAQGSSPTPTVQSSSHGGQSAQALEVAAQAVSAPLAGWWARAGGQVLDGLILIVAFVPMVLLFGPFGVLLDLGVIFAYSLLMLRGAENGQTLGMQAVGIRVRREDGQPVNIETVAIRQLLMKGIVFGLFWFLIIPPLLNYLWPLWDDENRALHDMVAKTRVVRA